MGGSASGGNGGRPVSIFNRNRPAMNAPAPGGFNVNTAAAGGLQQAMQGTQQAMGFQPQNISAAQYQPSQSGFSGYGASNIAGAAPISAQNVAGQGYGAQMAGRVGPVAAQNVNAGQVAGANLSAYRNPFESQVVQQTLTDLGGAQEKQLNQMGAQASAANAFGGSRHGVAEAETRRGFADQAARTVSGLRQAGFQNAQQLAGQDAAARTQAALANQAAGLQAGTTSAQLAQQANLANQAAANQAGQFGASAANQAALANQQSGLLAQQSTAANTLAAQQANQAAQNQAGQFGAAAGNQAALANQAARNQAGQFNVNQIMNAQQMNQAAGLQGNQQRLGAAGQMGQLGQQAFNTSQAIQQQQMQQGMMQQAMQQQLIDAARQQYRGYTGAPQAALSAPLQALGQTPVPQSQTTTSKPGLFDYMGAGMGMFGLG